MANKVNANPGGYGPAPLEEFEKQLLQDDDDGHIITMEMNDKGEMVPVSADDDE